MRATTRRRRQGSGGISRRRGDRPAAGRACPQRRRDVAAILEGGKRGPSRFVLHRFSSGDRPRTSRALALGGYLWISGILTFRTATLSATWRTAPTDRILVETDAPPRLAPHRIAATMNRPSCVTAEVLASVRGVSFADIAATTTDNFYRCLRRPCADGAATIHPRDHHGLRLLGRGAAHRWQWGAPATPATRRTGVASLLIEDGPAMVHQRGSSSIPAAICANSCSQPNVDSVDAVLFTHEHADHRMASMTCVCWRSTNRRVNVFFSHGPGSGSSELRLLLPAPPGGGYPPILNQEHHFCGERR